MIAQKPTDLAMEAVVNREYSRKQLGNAMLFQTVQNYPIAAIKGNVQKIPLQKMFTESHISNTFTKAGLELKMYMIVRSNVRLKTVSRRKNFFNF